MRTALISAMCCAALLGLSLAPTSAQASETTKKPVAQKSAANKPATKASAKSKAKTNTGATNTATRSKGTAKKVGTAAAAAAGGGAAVAAQNPGRLAVHSGAALVVEQGSENAYYQQNANAIMPIASITKLMTAMVVLDGVPDLKAPVTISGVLSSVFAAGSMICRFATGNLADKYGRRTMMIIGAAIIGNSSVIASIRQARFTSSEPQ